MGYQSDRSPARAPSARGDADPFLLEQARVGRLCLELLAQSEMLMVFFDGECYALHRTDREGRRSVAVRERPADLLASALGGERKKWCRACKCEHAASAFAKDKNQPDGLLPRCKVSERARVKEYEARKRSGAAAKRHEPGQGVVQVEGVVRGQVPQVKPDVEGQPPVG